MSTFVQMQNNIADQLNRTDLTTQIKTAITRAITFYDSKRFWFNETTGTLSTIINQESYGTADSLPTDILQIDDIRITINSTFKPQIYRRDYDFVKDFNQSVIASQPQYYAYYAQKIYLAPIPNQVWTLNLSYKKTYTTLSADSDTNDWTTLAEDLIESRARAWLYANIIKDADQAQIAQKVEMDSLNALIDKTNNMTMSRKIQATQF